MPTKKSAPAPVEINQLVALFNAGRYEELEKRTRLLIEKYPDSGFAWKALGASLLMQSKNALFAMQKATELLPNDADVHSNLGNALRALGQLEGAMASYQRALGIKPDYADAHSNLGNTLRDLGQFEGAAVSYQRALEINPDFAEAHYNLGNALRDLGQLENAVACYRRALEIKPDFPEAHFNLGNALQELGQLNDAVASYHRALEIKPDYAEVHFNLGATLKDLGQLNDAVASYRRALEIKPDYAEVRNNLGVALHDLGQLKDAVASYQRALEIKPDYAEVHNNLCVALNELGQLNDAEASCRRALEIKPDYAEAHSNLGIALRDLGQLESAVASYQRALEIKPGFAEAHYNLGNVLRDLGQYESAVASYQLALRIKPDLAEAHSNLGESLMELGKTAEAEEFLNKAMELSPGKAKPLATALLYFPYQPDDPRFSQLEAVYARRGSLPLKERIKLNFAMGKAMANIGQYDRSFSAYEEGNRLHYQAHPFDEVGHELFMKESCNIFTADLFNKCAALADTLPAIQDERVPIFIVGMPRSGTTLIEQILASHPAIYGAGEINILGDVAKKINPLFLDSANGADALLALRKLGQEYLDQVWKLAPDARYITDKMPGNYFHLGLIHLMLPNAKIIHSMRDPMDTCFSCYALQFTYGHEYSYDLGTLGRQYLRYRKMMEHWHNVLPPGRIIDVSYEDNVAHPEREARRLLEYLGLPWDPVCLKFHENRRPVHTASITQVRKPIYSSSVARWKHFEKHLGPLLEIIHPAKLSGIASAN